MSAARRFRGQTWCVTGTLEHYTPRALAIEEIARAGGASSGRNLTRATTHLLVGRDPGSKLQKARAWGVQIVTENEYMRMRAGCDTLSA